MEGALSIANEGALSIANGRCGMRLDRMIMNCVERFRGCIP
jgi:hypothetical protein